MPRRISLAARSIVVTSGLILLAIGLTLALDRWLPDSPWLIASLVPLIVLPLAIWAVRRQLRPMLSLFRALTGTVTSYRDGDFSFGLSWRGNDELGDLVAAHNELGDVLREQRLGLVQRELLLDTMVQNTPVAMLLVLESGPIVYANLAARRLLGQGKKLEGHSFDSVLENAAEPLREALGRGNDGLFSVGDDDEEEVYHLARRSFRLNGRTHELILLRLLTAELRRQEVQTWKKVIRVISHELNNSLAPVASLAHSGAELLRRGQSERLPSILATIEERARHLEGFIRGYARFAKLPAPRLETSLWPDFVSRLATQIAFIRRKMVALGWKGSSWWAAYGTRQDVPLASQSAADGRVPAPQPSAVAFRCDGRTMCSQMTSCAEATYFLQNCPGTKMDGNRDGVPC